MIHYLRKLIRSSRLLNFNEVNRERWIESQARLIAAGSHVLDAGAGSCPYRMFFSHCDYKSQDFVSLNDQQLAQGKYGAIDIVCDIAAIPVPDSSFDAILCSEVLEHLPDPFSVINEFARILKSGGRLILTAPLGSGIHQEPYHFYGGYTPFWYEKFLTEAGFESISVQANEGSLRACAQESIRFVQLSNPFRLAMPMWVKLLWSPFWLIALPIMALLAPVSATLLNKYDRDERFTIGYHVTALRKAALD